MAGLAEALANEFTIERELGHGGMGVVYLARDVSLDRQVALKVLPPTFSEDPEIRARFLSEARTAARLSHPNIVPVYRADERGGFAFFTMGYVDGETLGARLKDRGPLPPADVVRYLRETAWALAYAHAHGVVHRDVKPDNIMIERGSNRAMVTDFGIARSERISGLTAAGQVVGTAHYMSPEQIQGMPLDGRSDLYSLGVVGFQLLSGRLPFDAEAAPAVLVAHVTRPAPQLRSLVPDVPAALAAVIDRCLAKEPESRFASGEALSDALGKTLENFGDTPTDSSGGHRRLTEDQAAEVWRRAAQLQAEAAARLERESRSPGKALKGDASTSLVSSAEAEVAELVPTHTYRLRDVEAAAMEAGISQRFVALAISELPGENLPAVRTNSGGVRDKVGAAVLGNIKHSLSVSRVINAPARDVLKAMGRTFQGESYGMTLVDQLGPHPLDGGVLVFRLPGRDWMKSQSPFLWLRDGLYGKTLRATIRTLEHDSGSCEVSVFADLREGISINVWGYSAITASTTTVSGLVGGLIGVKSAALVGLAAALPAAGLVLLGGSLGLLASRAGYQWEVRKARSELEQLLDDLAGSLRSRNVFEFE